MTAEAYFFSRHMTDSAGSGEGALPSGGCSHPLEAGACLAPGGVSLWGPVSRLSCENCTEHVPLPTVRLSPCWEDLKVSPLPASVSSFACFLVGGRCPSPPPSTELSVPLTARGPAASGPGRTSGTRVPGARSRVRVVRSLRAGDMPVVFSDGRGSGVPVQVWACACV